jgi:hypothetical protein
VTLVDGEISNHPLFLENLQHLLEVWVSIGQAASNGGFGTSM